MNVRWRWMRPSGGDASVQLSRLNSVSSTIPSLWWCVCPNPVKVRRGHGRSGGQSGCSQTEVVRKIMYGTPTGHEHGPDDVQDLAGRLGSETLDGAITYSTHRTVRIDPARSRLARSQSLFEAVALWKGPRSSSVTKPFALIRSLMTEPWRLCLPSRRAGYSRCDGSQHQWRATLPGGFSWFEELIVEDAAALWNSGRR